MEKHYITFDQAMWLKSLGFNVPVNRFYTKPNSKMFGIDEHGRSYPIKNTAKKLYTVGEHQVLNGNNAYSAPEHHQVVEWLFKNHGIWIVANFANKNQWYFDLNKFGFDGKDKSIYKSDYNYNLPQEAYSAAFDYIKDQKLI
jgi:hypothetical protein